MDLKILGNHEGSHRDENLEPGKMVWAGRVDEQQTRLGRGKNSPAVNRVGGMTHIEPAARLAGSCFPASVAPSPALLCLIL